MYVSGDDSAVHYNILFNSGTYATLHSCYSLGNSTFCINMPVVPRSTHPDIFIQIIQENARRSERLLPK